MKNYLSMGMGVNSVAMHLMLLDQGVEFESVFVNHGTDYPETYEYLDIFQGWLKDNGHKQITVLPVRFYVKKLNRTFGSLYEYCWEKEIFPDVMRRWCDEYLSKEVLFNESGQELIALKKEETP